MAGFNPLNGIAQALKELKEEFVKFREEQRAFNEEQRAETKEIKKLLTELVFEVSRFKGQDSKELMISAFAFLCQNYSGFTTGEVSKFGRMVSAYSRRNNFRMEKMNDPRYGSVYVYEKQALKDCAETMFDGE